MTLYDTILQYEREEASAVMRKASEGNLLMKLGTALMGKRAVDGDVAKSQVLLDAAYRLQDSRVTDQELDYLVTELGNVDGQAFGLVPTAPELLAVRKDWVKARVEFYQQIVQHEGAVESFEDAVKQQFGNEASYRQAIQPVVEAERKMYSVLKEAMPATAGTMDASLNAANEVRETAMRYLFPRQLSE
jgi:hypothetical protein